MEPLVSIIIPFYKGEKLISETLESLFAQDYSNMEIIVVDDGSPTESLISLELYKDRITLISQKNSGQAVARNVGIAVSHGSIIALLDQDDIWPAGRLKNTLSYLTPESPYGFIRGLTKAFQILPDGTRLSSDPTLLPVLVGAALYKRETIDIVGPFDPTMRTGGEDFDWNIRLNETGIPYKEIPEITLLYRKHDTNHSITNEGFIEKGILLSVRKKLERMKKSQAQDK